MKMKISYYRANPDLLAKTFCMLAEKCFYSNMNTHVIAASNEYAETLDQVLWSYSKKHFIPHAMANDPDPEIQPILIATEIGWQNSPEIIFTVNVDLQIIKSCITEDIKKLIILEDEITGHKIEKIDQLIDDHKTKWQQFEKFQQSSRGSWEKL